MYDFLLKKRRENETETDRTLNDLLDRALISTDRLRTVNQLGDMALDKFMKRKENKYRNAEQKLGLLERSRALGLSPQQALNDDFLDEEAPLENVNAVVLSKRAAQALHEAPKAFSMAKNSSNIFSKIISAFKYR